MLAIAVNSFTQLIEQFLEIQNSDEHHFHNFNKHKFSHQVMLVQDVKHQWGSFYDMFKQIWELQKAVTEWVKKNKIVYDILQLSDEEWSHIDVLLKLLESFSQLTFAIDITADVNIHEIFQLYNWLFEQLERAKNVWTTRRDILYREKLLKAIKTAQDKLNEYYFRTDDDHDIFYNLGTVLDSIRKLSIYKICAFNWDLISSLTTHF